LRGINFDEWGDKKMTRDEFIEFSLKFLAASKGNYVDFFTDAIIKQKKEDIIAKLDQMKKLNDEICDAMGWNK
jgi:hypothetical protein